jgi:hypothetical protein
MLTGNIAVAVMAAFTGAAFYINVAEHPARLRLPARAALAQWKPSYRRGFAMQATLALLGTALGTAAFVQSWSGLWLAGALAALANWPFTLRFIMPVNRSLMAVDPERDEAGTMALLLCWGRLHACRTGLGLASVLCFLLAS